jgi:limonene 1,2-monooxygenase
MMGIEPTTQRPRMNEALDAIMALLRAEGPVTMKTDWFEMHEARLQMASYSDPHLPVAVAATFTPSGPMAAGKHGLGLLSVAGAGGEGFERTWSWMEEAAAEHGQTVDRGEWRVVVPIHLADSKNEAIEGVREGYAGRAYVGDRLSPDGGRSGGLFGGAGTDIEKSMETGAVIVGSPDEAITAVEAILEKSGGLGGVLGLAHEWASTEKTLRSYELWARYVAPRVQGHIAPLVANRDWIEERQGQVFGPAMAAFTKAYTDAGKEIPEQLRQAATPTGSS